MTNRIWTQDEIQFLETHYLKWPLRKIALHLNRGYRGTEVKACRLKLYQKAVKNIPSLTNLTETEKAYLAGFIDADGSIRMNITNINTIPHRATPIIEITNSRKDILDWITSKVNWSGKWETRNPCKKTENRYLKPHPHYHLSITGHLRVEPLLKAIYPYLRVKKSNAQKVLEFFKQRENRYGHPFSIQDWKLVLEVKELVNSRKAPHIRSRKRLAKFIKELEKKNN